MSVEVEGMTYNLRVHDTQGAEDYDRLRPLIYPYTQVYVICYSIDNRQSYNDVTDKVRYFTVQSKKSY